MSNGSRFGWSLKGHNRVTHRERGVIPNITKAHDIFVSIPLEVMRANTSVRADKFCQLINDWKDGVIGHAEFTAHPFHSGDTLLSAIINPSKPYNKDV